MHFELQVVSPSQQSLMIWRRITLHVRIYLLVKTSLLGDQCFCSRLQVVCLLLYRLYLQVEHKRWMLAEGEQTMDHDHYALHTQRIREQVYIHNFM